MIAKLDHRLQSTSQMIYQIFQSSYAVEAQLLNHPDFPPLKRTIHHIQQSKTVFYGFFQHDKLCGVTELELSKNHIHIRSLTVEPQYFRQGIGRNLLKFVVNQFDPVLLTVETGHLNQPAIDFYLDFGFKKNKIWMTDVGIEKISFRLSKPSNRKM